jgi:hypothetical protein
VTELEALGRREHRHEPARVLASEIVQRFQRGPVHGDVGALELLRLDFAGLDALRRHPLEQQFVFRDRVERRCGGQRRT